jgi:hypothetical protein
MKRWVPAKASAAGTSEFAVPQYREGLFLTKVLAVCR